MVGSPSLSYVFFFSFLASVYVLVMSLRIFFPLVHPWPANAAWPVTIDGRLVPGG